MADPRFPMPALRSRAASEVQRSGGPVVEVRELNVRFGTFVAVHKVSLSLTSGDVLGLVGESGSGKTTVCRAVAGILPPNAITAGDVIVHGAAGPLVRRPGARQKTRIGYVFQSPDAALNPCVRIGTQLTEALRATGISSGESWARAHEMLRRMRISNPDVLMRRYPHETSGGQQQRVCIGMALLNDPDVLVFDEPTTALDVTTQSAILDLLEEILATSSAPALYVTHDLRVVSRIAKRVAVMSRGEIVETGPAAAVLSDPAHPYTRALVASAPDLRSRFFIAPRLGSNGPPIVGSGCRYADRCPLAEDACLTAPIPLTSVPELRRLVRCRRITESRNLPLRPDAAALPSRPATAGAPCLTVSGMSVRLDRRRSHPPVLVDIDLELWRGRTVAVVGESGAGKTTLARALLGLVPPVGGTLHFETERLAPSVHRRPPHQLAKLQLVFQSSTSSLNPQQTVRSTLHRAIRRLGGVRARDADGRVRELLHEVHLPEQFLDRRPHQLSGGEKQRVAIARALAARPAIIVLDEAVSALDVSVQASILALLRRIQEREGTAFLFISHDLAVVAAFADEVIVLYGGKIVERGRTEDVLAAPHHPYTEVLFRSVPGEVPLAVPALKTLEAPLDRASRGCIFASRCPWRIGAVCDDVEPPLQILNPSHAARCHYDPSTLTALIDRDRSATAAAHRDTHAVTS